MPAETPPVAPEVPVTPATDTDIPPAPKMIMPEDDPNLKLQQMVSRRGAPKPEDKAKEVPKDDAKKEEKPAEEPPVDNKKLSVLIGKALGFRDEKPKEDAKKPEDAKKEEVKEEKKVEDPPKEAAKTIVKPKKTDKASPVAAPVADPVKMAAAAATAAVKAMIPEQKPPQSTTQTPEDLLKSDDLHEYEVAQYLAKSNPRFKDAPKVILEHVKKAEAYANRWEQDNKGKTFDPDDEEHDDFYSSLEKPWKDHEFRMAETEMVAERVNKSSKKESDDKIHELEVENARISITPVIERTYTAAAGLLAKKVGDDVHEKIVKGSFEKFSEEDPITAEALASTIGSLQPLIEVAIQLDDPKSRFKFDPKNQVHMEWNQVMLEKESQLSGADDGSGRTMVSRAEFSNMTQAQRTKHWFLTTEHLIEEIVNDAATSVKASVEKEKERQKKIALSLGFVPKEDSGNGKTKADATKKEDTKKEAAPDATTKPQSPASGGGAKVDDKAAGKPAVSSKLLETTASILFRR